jgi:hypothetical protein
MTAGDAVDGSRHRHHDVPDCDLVCRNANVRSWLQADLQPPEIDFRFSPESRRFRGLG